MHAEFKCQCGAEHGNHTDHDQTEKLCPTHVGGSGFRTVPVYAKGYEAPAAFEAFQADQEQAAAAAAPKPAEPEAPAAPEPVRKKK